MRGCCRDLNYSMELDFAAEPVIFRGRLIMMAIFLSLELEEPISFSTLSRTQFQVCPHLCATDYLFPENPFLTALRLASAHGQRGLRQKVHSCDQCPTIYLIALRDGWATFHLWHDLGTENSPPADPCWHSHLRDVDHKNVFSDTQFSYKYGSVRNWYHTYRLGTQS